MGDGAVRGAACGGAWQPVTGATASVTATAAASVLMGKACIGAGAREPAFQRRLDSWERRFWPVRDYKRGAGIPAIGNWRGQHARGAGCASLQPAPECLSPAATCVAVYGS